MDSSGIYWFREGSYVSRETILHTPPGTEQLNDALACMLELLQRFTSAIPTPNRYYQLFRPTKAQDKRMEYASDN